MSYFIGGNDALKLPSGGVAERPLDAEDAMVRYNEEDHVVEVFSSYAGSGSADWLALQYQQDSESSEYLFSLPLIGGAPPVTRDLFFVSENNYCAKFLITATGMIDGQLPTEATEVRSYTSEVVISTTVTGTPPLPADAVKFTKYSELSLGDLDINMDFDMFLDPSTNKYVVRGYFNTTNDCTLFVYPIFFDFRNEVSFSTNYGIMETAGSEHIIHRFNSSASYTGKFIIEFAVDSDINNHDPYNPVGTVYSSAIELTYAHNNKDFVSFGVLDVVYENNPFNPRPNPVVDTMDIDVRMVPITPTNNDIHIVVKPKNNYTGYKLKAARG